MNEFDQRIASLQEQRRKDGLKAYIIPSTDPNRSEECCSRFAAERFYFCPFKGNDGTLLVTLDNYYIYTDGRYWTEAESEIASSRCKLVYAGKAGVPSLSDFVKDNELYPLGLDSSLFSLGELNSFFLDSHHEIRQVSYSYRVKDRPSFPNGKIWKVDENLLSLSREERVDAIRKAVNKKGAKAIVVPRLDEIAYVLGYRGSDIPCTPVFYSYLYIDENKDIHLFIDANKLPDNFHEDKVLVHSYDSFASFLDSVKDVPTLVDPNKTNAFICAKLKNKIFAPSPVFAQKSVKGPSEIKNTKEVQAIDGIAVLKLRKYIDETVDTGRLNELNCAEYIDNARRSNPRCFDLSFGTIAATDSNAARMHYAPSKEKYSPLTRANQLLLVDSGGQYYGGTTDTTRTFIVSKHVSEEVKHDYTLTLKSQIALSTTVFEKGCTGHSIDIRAREIRWKEGRDYKCGTGHGVGYRSCVHEGPIGFRFYDNPDRGDKAELQLGHIITIEPGVYKAHHYGIRLENNLLVVPAFETDDGIFYKFETITYVPYDRRGINVDRLDQDELEWLNNYHHRVFEKLAPYCQGDPDLLAYLVRQTAPLYR